MEWSSWLEQVSGELYWDSIFGYQGVNHQDPSKWGGKVAPDPWTMQTPTGDPKSAGSGDGNLLAPGTPSKIGGSTHIPVESVRLKSLRDGVEDPPSRFRPPRNILFLGPKKIIFTSINPYGKYLALLDPLILDRTSIEPRSVPNSAQ